MGPTTAVYREATCRSALTRVKGMPFEWSLNPYRGCQHACVYCYAREYHAKMGRDIGAGFDREIEVKVNFAEVLREELARMRVLPHSVAIGTGTDPYQPCEGKYRITRACLEALRDRSVPLSIVTKSPMVVRDADVLADVARRTGGEVRIFFSVGTVDDGVWRSTEPGTASPAKRLAAMRRLREAGIKAGVLCAPVLPGLSDSEESLDAVARAAHEHGAYFFGSRVLKLDPHVKDYYLTFVAQEIPSLLPLYGAAYSRGAYGGGEYMREIERRIRQVRSRYRFPEDDEEDEASEPEPAAPESRQLSLAI
jgi:DNA repair photolyase